MTHSPCPPPLHHCGSVQCCHPFFLVFFNFHPVFVSMPQRRSYSGAYMMVLELDASVIAFSSSHLPYTPFPRRLCLLASYPCLYTVLHSISIHTQQRCPRAFRFRMSFRFLFSPTACFQIGQCQIIISIHYVSQYEYSSIVLRCKPDPSADPDMVTLRSL